RLVRSFRPHVILAYDENGGYPHPDHIMSHRVAVEAWDAAGDPERYPGTGEPGTPRKRYYDRAFNVERFQALHEALVERGLPSPYAERLAQWAESEPEGAPPVSRHETTTQIPMADTLAVRDDALRAHESQVDPEGFFFAVAQDIQREVWPWEDYVLAASRVPESLPEHDLAAGIGLDAAPAGERR
ncbi:mycothiol conjugate amidase Mca, partial [Staphylococcus sp. EG-SA-29]|nr:mycothiol conjugate amidase Mca [Staphylococcus sp. EG-SA-29]